MFIVLGFCLFHKFMHFFKFLEKCDFYDSWFIFSPSGTLSANPVGTSDTMFRQRNRGTPRCPGLVRGGASTRDQAAPGAATGRHHGAHARASCAGPEPQERVTGAAPRILHAWGRGHSQQEQALP